VNLSPEAWGAVGIGVTTVGSVVVAHLRTKAELRQQAAQVERVRVLAEPTGNGWATDMKSALARIERRQEQDSVAARKAAELLAEHLHDHARAVDRPR
jgi:hypothetical protein